MAAVELVRITFTLISSTALCGCRSEQLRQSFAVAMGAGVVEGEWHPEHPSKATGCVEKETQREVWYDDMMTFLWGSWYHCQLKGE